MPIVEARALIRLNPPMPASREAFKGEVLCALRIAESDAKRLPDPDLYDLSTVLEEIARLADVWKAKEIEQRAGAG